MKFSGVLAAALLLPGFAQAGEAGDILAQHLYAGTLVEGQAALREDMLHLQPKACFGWSVLKLAEGIEGLAQDLYRYGATTPASPATAMLLGVGISNTPAPANPDPEVLTYEGLRTVISDFRSDIAEAQKMFECPTATASFVAPIDVLKARLDFNGDGKTEDGETLGVFMQSLIGDFSNPEFQAPSGKTKGKPTAPPVANSTVGFDAADSIWFAGYTQAVQVQLDVILAHDFEDFFNAYLHRIFPDAGLPMQDYSSGAALVFDPESDAGIADLVAAIHTMNFPVVDRERFQSIPAQLKHITELSRKNWDFIMAETDDNRELVPNPTQTSLVPDTDVTPETVAAWRETLDVLDQIIDGDLLIPHWRFKQGFDLNAFFANSERTDIVMLLTGLGALPYLADGPIADASSFTAANRVFGDRIFDYAIWFN